MENNNWLKYFLITYCFTNATIAVADTNDFTESTEHYSNFNDAIKGGKPYLAFRLRHENSHQENLKTAKATTLRSKVGYISGIYSNTNLNLEAINVANFFGQHYNPNVTEINRPEYAVINDPKGTGITKFNLNFAGLETTQIILGRQYISLDNQRFVGTIDYRQFPQTFDAISINNNWFDNLNIFYAFVIQVNNNKSNSRTTDGRNKLKTHLFNLAWDGFDYGKLSGYAYFNKDKTIKSNSHLILGVRAASAENVVETYGISYALEFAQQQAKSGNPNHYTAYYTHGEIGKPIDPIEAKLGFERFTDKSNSAVKSFITPLGSTRNFDGLSEAISSNTTNGRGLQDLYLKICGKISDFSLTFTYHHFRFDAGSRKKLGNEFDITASMALNEDVALSATYAKFNPSGNSSIANTRKIWVQLDTKFM
jgi:hypothetical protein